MQCIFYQYAATPERVDKSAYLTEIGRLNNVYLKEDTNLMQPVIYLKSNPIVYNSNYLFLGDTQRYYYINNITAVTGGRIAIDGKIDVLYTYRAEILESTAWVETSSDTSSPDYMRQDFPFTQRKFVRGINFPTNPFTYTDEHRNCLLTFL